MHLEQDLLSCYSEFHAMCDHHWMFLVHIVQEELKVSIDAPIRNVKKASNENAPTNTTKQLPLTHCAINSV